MEQSIVKPSGERKHAAADDRPVIGLFCMVITAIVVIGWFAFFSGPAVPAEAHSTTIARHPGTSTVAVKKTPVTKKAVPVAAPAVKSSPAVPLTD